MKQVLRFIIYLCLLGAAFFAGYRLTDVWFRLHRVPYPFQLYGIAAGLGFSSLSFSLLQIVELVLSRLFIRKKADKPYRIKVEDSISEVELLK